MWTVGRTYAILGSFANHVTLGLRAISRCLALPLATWLLADVIARLFVLSALHLAHGLAASSLALWTIACSASTLWAKHCTVWPLALHAATLRIESLAACSTLWCLADRSTYLVTLFRLALPQTLRCATVVIGLEFDLCCKLVRRLPRSIRCGSGICFIVVNWS